MKTICLAAMMVLLSHCGPSGQLGSDQGENHLGGSTQVIAENTNQLFQSPHDLVLGNPNGHTAVVEFFDYNCGYCKRTQPEVSKLIDSDPDVRVVIKELPVLGPGSVFAARAALASAQQGKYAVFHNALNSSRSNKNELSVLQIAAEVGLDIQKLRNDMQDPTIEEVLSLNLSLARSLSITGTPSFVIGETVLHGFMPHKSLAQYAMGSRAR